MIFITGDIHGDVESFILDCEWYNVETNDYVIICGDFGGVWFSDAADNDNIFYKESYSNFWYAEKKLDKLAEKPYTVLFIDGNHENHERLNRYPVELWNGGKVHKIRNNIFHLMRGEIFNIEGKTFFAMGGAESHDIRDGILDPYKDFEKIKEWSYDCTKLFRIDGISWWKNEVPSNEELHNALMNLAENDFTVDYVLTHELPSSSVVLISKYYKPTEYAMWLQNLRSNLNYKKWFGGHYHIDHMINEKDYVLYDDFYTIR